MALIATRGAGAEFKTVPQGVHLARCYRVIDLGTQKTEWQGKEKWSRKVLFSWELHGEDDEGEALVMDDGQPLSVHSRYTLSLGDNAAMRSMLEGWRGRAFTDDELAGFDISAVLGHWCMVNVVHAMKGGKTYTNVAGVTPVPKMLRAKLPLGVNPALFFDVTEPDPGVFEQLSDRLQETIAGCKERQRTNHAASASAGSAGHGFEDMDSDIPF